MHLERSRLTMKADLVVMTAALFLLCCLQSVTHAQSRPAKTKHPWYKQWGWTTQSWTGDSRPYQQRRQIIDALIASGKKPADLLPQYETLAKEKPNDPQRLFSWAYIIYQIAAARQMPWNLGDNMLEKPRQAFADVPSPHAYEYDRLRFLAVAYGPFYDDQLKPMARRLLLHDPNDAKVKTKLAYMLSDSKDPAEQQQASVLAQEIAKADPTTLIVYMVPAAIYMSRWLRLHDKEDADKASAAYQQWLQHAPADDAFRQDAETHMRVLQDSK